MQSLKYLFDRKINHITHSHLQNAYKITFIVSRYKITIPNK